jgi:hypothetical protein
MKRCGQICWLITQNNILHLKIHVSRFILPGLWKNWMICNLIYYIHIMVTKFFMFKFFKLPFWMLIPKPAIRRALEPVPFTSILTPYIPKFLLNVNLPLPFQFQSGCVSRGFCTRILHAFCVPSSYLLEEFFTFHFSTNVRWLCLHLEVQSYVVS